MRVKKLDLFGFKSFAQKTTVHFEPGVTAIVGPNGSGKSNIVDSIRWVLGEHNPRDVRAPRLEDVIFNGTDRRAPLSMAEVSLTIDNEQGRLPISFTDVTVTRRVYRSGESECFINQSPCRLKDIQELFLGTGLGGGTYAIIEQGHIDLILSSKPEERRVVFEEASGIAKYLSKRQETLRRLDEVEEHLVRIADIIGEVRRQVGALERAANKARQYQAQWEQLKQLELRLAVDELSAGEARASALEETGRRLTAQRAELETQKQGHVAALEAANAAVSAIQERVQSVRTTVVECASRIEQHDTQHALKTRWIEERTAQARQMEQEAVQLRARLTQVDEQLARTGGGASELEAQIKAVRQQLEESLRELAALEAAAHEQLQAVDQQKAALFSAASEASHRRNQLAQTTSRLQALEAQLARLQEQRTQRATHAEALRVRREGAAGERATLQASHEGLQQRIASAQQALEASGVRRHELTGHLHQLREQLAGERAQARLLEDLWRRYDGFPETVKTLMGHTIEGLIGPLVDVVQAAPGSEEMVEAALGPLAEALVVRDRQALARCRELLSARQLEGCRFLVLSDCPTAPLEMELPAVHEGLSGSVKQHVRAAPEFQPLVDWLLNDSWIVEDLHRFLGEGIVPQSRLVSARGDRWDRRSWRFSGSAAARAQSRLGRKHRWEQAQQRLQRVEQAAAQLETEAHVAEQQWQSHLAEAESAKGQLAHAASGLHGLDSQLSQLAHEAQRIEHDARAAELELRELAAQREELREEREAAQRAADEATRSQQDAEAAFAGAQAAREQALLRRQELLIAKAQVETTWQSLTERCAALEARAQELGSDRSRLLEQIDARERQRQEAAARSQELSQQLQAHREAVRQLQDERQHLDDEVGRASQALREEERKRDQLLPHLLAVEQQLSTVAQKIQEQGQQLSERAFRRSRLVERLKELYQIDEAMIQAELQAEASPLTEEQRAAMAEQIQKLRAKLEGIGPVSLGSVEEYDELKRRLEFLQAQQQDLLKARDDLKASITQINRTARSQFRETFERITQEFQHYFGRLFQGGQADLILMDEEDVLESGIDIVARPPGKRLQSISLLSGGERALTAVALLFALFKVRPSPFCVLDEIDAPLDEANVDRFTRVLEEFLSLSQFILVTHNKKTITKADCLYGVTMEEAGVSFLLSAKLTQPEPVPSATTPAPAAVSS